MDHFNRNLYDALEKVVGCGYDPVVGNEVVSAVHESLIDALRVDDDEVVPDASLTRDLNAESIDSLDLSFRLERRLGIKVSGDERSAMFLEVTPKFPNGREKTVLELTRYVYDAVKKQGPVVL